jgi:hypothetical protein
MLKSLLMPPKPTIRHRVGTEKGLYGGIHPLGLLRNPWQKYGAVDYLHEPLLQR